MVVLNQRGSENPRNYDLSFMYTKRCDLACSFCMYRSGPAVQGTLDLAKLEHWLHTVDPERIASFGVYGGEPGIDLMGFGRCLVLAERIIGVRPRFVITNGTWSTDAARTERFLDWAGQHRLSIVVSGTPEHRKFQDRKVLENLAAQQPTAIRLKPEEENLHAMGRLEGKMPFSCSMKCVSWDRALRIAVQPDGSVIYQNCDGVYPVVGTISETFTEIDSRVQLCRQDGFARVCPMFGEQHAKRQASSPQ